MKVAGLLVLLLVQGVAGGFDGNEVDPRPERFRLERAVEFPAGSGEGQACFALDAAVYAHTAGKLTGMRLYTRAGSGGVGTEVPFALTESGEAGQHDEAAQVLNLGKRGRAIVFDLAMPHRRYTEVKLDLEARDFLAAAKVSGMAAVGERGTDLGEYALFDLSTQRLSRSTSLPLQEASFPVLHVELTMSAAPGGSGSAEFEPRLVRGATVPPSRYAQTLYTTVAETGAVAVEGRASVAHVRVAAHVPVERVRFVLQPGFAKNFSRDVRVTATPLPDTDPKVAALRAEPGTPETFAGTIQRVRLPGDGVGQAIRQEQMSVDAVLSANLQSDAKVDVAVENGDDAPLALRAVELQMRQRMVCFDAEPGRLYLLRYGDAERVRAPAYDYGRLFRASDAAAAAVLGPEAANPEFRADAEEKKSYLARHPELVWVALLGVIVVLGAVAMHSARTAARR